MKKIMLLLILGLSGWVQAVAIDSTAASFPHDLQPTQLEVKAAHMAADIISRYHYKAVPLDQALSEKIFDRYLKALDPEKSFFLQADVDRFSGERDKMGPAIRRDDLSVPFAIFNVSQRRVAQRFQYARNLLKHGFDFQVDERFQISRETQPWPQTTSELDELWRKRVKSEWLSLKLAGKDDPSIVKTLDKRYEHALKRVSQTTNADAFQTFMNAYTMSIEPHTNYMGPRAVEEFDIAMRLSLVGIGASISSADDTATISELTAGGPASRSGQIKVGDRIVGVAQGAAGPMVDVVGWRPDDLIELIRGPAETVVRLAVLPADAADGGKQKFVSLVRKPVGLEEDAAKSSIETVSDGATSRRIGVITLPSFYEDFAGKHDGDPNFKSATHDVQRLLTAFKSQHVDAVLVDLRGNGGGSLTQAIELTSLFIGNVPVVQQRDATGDVVVGIDTQASVVWHGPLGVLIDKRSASASEIFAAAIQDYGRGVIIGQPSFGKGTVQSMIDLDELAKSAKPQLGELKMTVAQFFRVSGGTTQLKGVVPDIGFPGIFDEGTPGESGFDNALPWTQIKAVYYSPRANVKSILPVLAEQHALRIKQDPDFKNLQADIDEFKRQRDMKDISLNEAERRKERVTRQAQLAARQANSKHGKPGTGSSGASLPNEAISTALDDGLLPGERSVTEELRVEKSLKSIKDIVLIEATRIMSNAIGLLRPMYTWS
ncbi:carboxy terminal-processing peptidase [Rhodoferax sp.]|uniref:carboxy terminal-processing peptidase n=1 Tax=Rhodoferax sp. TaxID=50421 RepID=UPI0028410E1A|nr:carboxy terminal-processing peptidase [Rhodoferax sp.]MDR3369088.1 carboxy terminal-processing peptidase [Rhodoferax sp.]